MFKQCLIVIIIFYKEALIRPKKLIGFSGTFYKNDVRGWLFIFLNQMLYKSKQNCGK